MTDTSSSNINSQYRPQIRSNRTPTIKLEKQPLQPLSNQLTMHKLRDPADAVSTTQLRILQKEAIQYQQDNEKLQQIISQLQQAPTEEQLKLQKTTRLLAQREGILLELEQKISLQQDKEKLLQSYFDNLNNPDQYKSELKQNLQADLQNIIADLNNSQELLSSLQQENLSQSQIQQEIDLKVSQILNENNLIQSIHDENMQNLIKIQNQSYNEKQLSNLSNQIQEKVNQLESIKSNFLPQFIALQKQIRSKIQEKTDLESQLNYIQKQLTTHQHTYQIILSKYNMQTQKHVNLQILLENEWKQIDDLQEQLQLFKHQNTSIQDFLDISYQKLSNLANSNTDFYNQLKYKQLTISEFYSQIYPKFQHKKHLISQKNIQNFSFVQDQSRPNSSPAKFSERQKSLNSVLENLQKVDFQQQVNLKLDVKTFEQLQFMAQNGLLENILKGFGGLEFQVVQNQEKVGRDVNVEFDSENEPSDIKNEDQVFYEEF